MKSSSPRPVVTRHIPQRTCIVCRQVKEKRELVRLVRTPEGSIEIDRSGKMTGRGAYLCHRPQCWETGLKNNKLEHALRGKLTGANRERLTASSSDLIQGDN